MAHLHADRLGKGDGDGALTLSLSLTLSLTLTLTLTSEKATAMAHKIETRPQPGAAEGGEAVADDCPPLE